MSTKSPAVEMLGIVKRFPGVLANDHADLRVEAGEIHALLGENGAGKSTLMNILAGLYRPDEGRILLHGRQVTFRSPRDAIAAGIGMVHQHFMLVETQTVAENIILGLDRPRFRLDMKRVERDVADMSRRYGIEVDPDTPIWQLSVGEQQRVEILKALYCGADVLILDEPTAVLTPQEADQLGDTIFRLAGEGKSIIYITHKMREVYKTADRVTVLRGGRVVGTTTPKATTEAELARMMVGREVLFHLQKAPARPGKVALALGNVSAQNDKGLPALKGFSLEVREGEIVGIAGVAGNGQRELAEVITGLRKVKSGCVEVYGREVTNCSSRAAIEEGISHVPEDRLGMGLVPNLPIADNSILKSYRKSPVSRGIFLDRGSVLETANKLIQMFQISAPGPSTPVKLLSGGNLQKVILAREIAVGDSAKAGRKPMMVAVHPTRGLDVGATEAVRNALLDQRAAGAAILLISEDLDELLAVADRIVVIYGGESMGAVQVEQANLEEIGLMMAGKRVDAVPQPVAAGAAPSVS